MNNQELDELKGYLKELTKVPMPNSVKEAIFNVIDKISDEQNFLLLPKEKQS